MKRGTVLASVLAAATMAAFTTSACADPAPEPVAALDRWKAGTNYTLLATPQPPAVKRGKVEVNEVFWYGCSHCYALDPALESWKLSKPAYIEFVRIPVIWGPVHVQHARLYYTLQALGRADLHPKVFDTIHRKGNMLAAQTEEEARALQLAFLRENGVTEKKFNEVYDSRAVIEGVERAQTLTGRFEVASVPLMVVQGKYVTSVSQAGSEKDLLALVNDLAASEKGR
jgi:thiol:disulfide interchange protein DsbA